MCNFLCVFLDRKPGQLFQDDFGLRLVICVDVFQVPVNIFKVFTATKYDPASYKEVESDLQSKYEKNMILLVKKEESDLQSRSSSVSPLTGSSRNWESSTRWDTASIRTSR